MTGRPISLAAGGLNAQLLPDDADRPRASSRPSGQNTDEERAHSRNTDTWEMRCLDTRHARD